MMIGPLFRYTLKWKVVFTQNIVGILAILRKHAV